MQIVPDQMQVINPALVLILIPIFDRVFYPCLQRLNLLENPLHRMAIGGLIAGTAFLSAGILELILERTYPELPDNNEASLNFINTLPCHVSIYNPFNTRQIVQPYDMVRFNDVYASNHSSYYVRFEVPKECEELTFEKKQLDSDIVAIECQVKQFLVTLLECLHILLIFLRN